MMLTTGREYTYEKILALPAWRAAFNSHPTSPSEDWGLASMVKQNQAAGPGASMGTEFKKASHALKENYVPLWKL